MIGLNKRSYSLTVARDIEKLMLIVGAIYEKNSDFLILTFPHNIKIQISDNNEMSNYSFLITNPTSIKGITHFTTEIFPESEHTTSPITKTLPFNVIIDELHLWISLIQEYNSISFSQEGYFQQIYEQEFYDAFELVDEDADTAPFDLQKQLLLETFLISVNNALEDNRELYDVQPFIDEVNEVRQAVTTSTKKVLIKKISKLFSKIRLSGLGLLKDVIKDYIKDNLIKEGLRIAFEVGIKYIQNPQNFL